MRSYNQMYGGKHTAFYQKFEMQFLISYIITDNIIWQGVIYFFTVNF